jgi:hypothetical protein
VLTGQKTARRDGDLAQVSSVSSHDPEDIGIRNIRTTEPQITENLFLEEISGCLFSHYLVMHDFGTSSGRRSLSCVSVTLW